MRDPSRRLLAPRSPSRVGALLRSAVLASVLFALPLADLAGQEPPDSLAAPPDRAALDSLALLAQQDTVSADTIFYNLPRFEGEAPDGYGTGVWSWDHGAIMATGANTLAELVAEVPGVLVLAAGDYGTPAGISAFGAGGGGLRVFRDGFEVYPLEGGIVDLARIGLAGIRRVRLDRGMTEVRLELWSLEYDDGRPYSLVEAGTGDLDTNIFRGTFANPTALAGSVALGLERVDSRGPRGEEEGNRTGSWLRYQLHRGDGAGLAFDFRRMGTESEVPDYASPIARTDWAVRGRARLAEGVVGEAYSGKSSHQVDDEREPYQLEGGSRSQHGLRLGIEGSGFWGRGEARFFKGDDLPARRIDLSGGGSRPGFGGVSADLTRGSWAGVTTSSRRVRAWTRPLLGAVSFFGSWESGTHGARTIPLLDVVLPPDTTVEVDPEPQDDEPDADVPASLFGITDRTAKRLGATLSWGRISLSGAVLEVEADSVIPLGIEPDRGSPFLAGVERTGWELWGTVPTPWRSLRLEGSLQKWDPLEVTIPLRAPSDPPYMPEEIYRGALVFHRTYLESENFELWWKLGVRGNSPMNVHILGVEDDEGVRSLETVPFYQNWYARVQVRIVTVQIFIGWDNFIRRPNLQSFPGRVLPITRTWYGLRWTMWN